MCLRFIFSTVGAWKIGDFSEQYIFEKNPYTRGCYTWILKKQDGEGERLLENPVL